MHCVQTIDHLCERYDFERWKMYKTRYNNGNFNGVTRSEENFQVEGSFSEETPNGIISRNGNVLFDLKNHIKIRIRFTFFEITWTRTNFVKRIEWKTYREYDSGCLFLPLRFIGKRSMPWTYVLMSREQWNFSKIDLSAPQSRQIHQL